MRTWPELSRKLILDGVVCLAGVAASGAWGEVEASAQGIWESWASWVLMEDMHDGEEEPTRELGAASLDSCVAVGIRCWRLHGVSGNMHNLATHIDGRGEDGALVSGSSFGNDSHGFVGRLQRLAHAKYKLRGGGSVARWILP